MMSRRGRRILLLASLVAACGVVGLVLARSPRTDYAGLAFAHMQHLSEAIGERQAGTDGDRAAQEYLVAELEKLGYRAERQPVELGDVSSCNLVATFPTGSEGQVVVGAHHDADLGSKGASDNASGVGVLLALAARLRDRPPPCDVVLVAFAAEESQEGVGMGSHRFVEEMTPGEVESTLAYVNLDTLVGGDRLYVHSAPGGSPDVRDEALAIAKRRRIELFTNPGSNRQYPEGTAGAWSDHVHFAARGIPIAYFESTNWDAGEKDGYTQTATAGSFWNSPRDTIAEIEAAFPGRIDRQLRDVFEVLCELVGSI